MVSVTRPIGEAFERMKAVLFTPFDAGKWFILGFSAFLAGLGEGGGMPSCNIPGGQGSGRGGPGGGGGPGIGEAKDFLQEHLLVIVILGAAVLVALVCIGALVVWLSSRGRFMFLDNVANNRAEVRAPWSRFRELGNRFFVFRFLLQLSMSALALVVVALAVVLAWPDIQAEQIGTRGIVAIAWAGAFFVSVGIAFAIFMAVVKDFVVPIMALRNVRPLAALGIFRRELLAGNLGVFVLFYLMKIVLGIGGVFAAGLAICLTCCVAYLPYIGAVILLPISVFFQCYTLCFLEQFGGPWRFFPDYSPPPADSRSPWGPAVTPTADSYWGAGDRGSAPAPAPDPRLPPPGPATNWPPQGPR